MEEDSCRLHVELGEELAERFKRVVPKGMKSIVVRNLLRMLVEDIEKRGQGSLAIILSGDTDIRSVIQNLNRREPPS